MEAINPDDRQWLEENGIEDDRDDPSQVYLRVPHELDMYRMLNFTDVSYMVGRALSLYREDQSQRDQQRSRDDEYFPPGGWEYNS